MTTTKRPIAVIMWHPSELAAGHMVIPSESSASKFAHQPGTFEPAPAAFLTRHHALRDASPTRDADRQLDPHHRLQCRTCQPRPVLARIWERIWSAPCRRVSKPDARSGSPLAAALPKGLDPEPFWPLS